MTPKELGQILAAATVLDARVEVGDEAAAAWFLAIGELDARDCQRALIDHYRQSRDRVMAADFHERVRAMERARAEAAPGMAKVMNDVDPDAPGYVQTYQERLRAYREERRAQLGIGSGNGGQP